MQPIPYIFFKNDAREAFAFYGEVFGNEPEIMAAGDAMPGVDPETVMHAALRVGDGWIYGSADGGLQHSGEPCDRGRGTAWVRCAVARR